MAEVSLLQRSQLPPSRVGAVKPPDIPEISDVGFAAELGGDILGKIRATRAGNEQSEFLGSVAAAQERAATQIADNPGMPFEDMDKIQKQMMTEINKAGESLELPESKNYARNFTLKNRQLIEEKFNTQKEAILTRHEITRFNLERERLIAERKPDELNKLYEGASGKLLDPEVATLAFANDISEIDALQAEFEKSAYLEAVAVTTRGLPLDDALKYINEIPRTKITEAERNGLLSQRNNQEALQNDILEVLREENRDAITKGIRAGEDVTDLIENGPLDETEQARMLERARLESERRVAGKDLVVDWDVYGDLQDTIKDYDNKKISKEDARKAINAEAGKTITEAMAKSFYDDIATIDDPDDPMNRSDVKRGLGFLEDLETAEVNAANKAGADYEEIRKLRQKYQKKKNEYEQWIKKQEKLTGKDIENKTKEMTQPPAEDVVLNWFERLMWQKGDTQLFGLVGSQEERLVNKKIKKLQELGKWEGLTPDEQETIRQAFSAGKSIQDVLDIMGQ